MKDKWFRIYEYTDAVFNDKGKQTQPPAFGPIDDEPLHVYATDSYHPDPRVRLAHGQSIPKTGRAKTACGKEIDPRMIYIEAHDETDRCSDCIAAMADAESVHQEAEETLVKKRIATLKAKLTELGVEIPE